MNDIVAMVVECEPALKGAGKISFSWSSSKRLSYSFDSVDELLLMMSAVEWEEWE